MRPDLEALLISPEQEQKIKRKLPNQMPTNPTAQGWSGKQIQKFLTRALFDLDGSLYSELKSKLIAIKDAFAAVFEEINTMEHATKWLFGDLVSDESLIIEEDLLQDVYLGDYYLNNRSGNVYTCVSKENGFLTFEYVFNIKDMFDNESNDTETEISYTLENNLDKTFKAENIESIELIIPNSVNHGFCCGVNFKVGNTPPNFSIINNSNYPLKLRVYGMDIDNYIPTPNRTVAMSIYCDDINVYCYVNEVA